MADSLIGSLRVALSLGTADFEAGANKAASVAKTKAKEIEGAFNGAKMAVSGLFAAFTVGLLTEQIKKSLDYAGSIAEVSRTLGVTTKDLQTFRYAATQTGVSQEALEKGLQRLTVSMGKAELGSKAQIKAFGALGITVDQLKGKTTGDVFRMMSDSLSKVTDRSQRAAVEWQLMGRGAGQLDNMLAPGSRRLNELAEAAQRLGIVLSDSQIQGAEETAHKLEAVKMVLAANLAGVVAGNAHAILSLASAFGQLTAQIVQFMSKNPAVAFGLMGAALGRTFGPYGAIVGGIAGAAYGTSIETPFDPSDNPHKALLQHNLAFENNRLKQMIAGGARDKTGNAAYDAQKARVMSLTERLNAANGRVASTPAGTDLPQFLAGDKKPKKAPRDKNEQDEFQFAQEQRQLDLQILEAKKSLSHDVSDQAEISLQMIGIQSAIKDAEIDHKVEQAKRDFAQKKITASTLAQIETEAKIEKGKEAQLTDLQRKAVLDQRDQQLLQESISLDQQGYDIMRGDLEKQLGLAQTADERLKIELQILDLTYKWRRILDQRIIDESKDPVAVLHAQADLAAIPKDFALDRQNALKQNQGPLGQYLQTLPTDAAKWQEALQGVAVNGFGALEQAILDTVSGTKKLGAAFADMAKSIIADLIKISIEKAIIAPLAKALFPQAASGGGLAGALGGLFGGGGGGVTDLTGMVPSFASSLGGGGAGIVDLTGPAFAGAFPGFASGGSMRILGNMGTDRNMLSVNGMPIARVGYGETMHVVPKGGLGRSGGNVTIHAPITINSPVSNDTAGQLARELNVRLAQARTKGF